VPVVFFQSSAQALLRLSNVFVLTFPSWDFIEYTSTFPEGLGLPDAFCKNTGHFDLSTVPDLNCFVFRKRHRENGDTISIVLPQLIICLYFGWLIAFRCVRDAKIAPRIASTAANKLRLKNCPDKIHH